MSGFDTTLDVLLKSENVDAPRLLSHVLAHGDLRLRRRAVERLIDSTDGRFQVLLLRHFDDLGHELESQLVANVGRLGPALRRAMASRETKLQSTVIQLARDAQDYSLAYLAGEAINLSSAAVQTQAVDLLWRWALELRRREMALDGSADLMLDAQFSRRRKFVLEGLQRAFALGRAAEMPRVLTAAAMLAEASTGWFWCAMDGRRDGRRIALLERLGEKLEPELLCFAVRALNHENIAGDAAELLNRSFDRQTLAALLREFNRAAHLGRAALARLREMPWLGAGETALETLPANLVATALALAAGSGMSRARLAVLCRSVAVNHEDVEARRMAIEALAHCSEAAVEELRLVAGRAASPSAGMAVLHLARRGALKAAADELVTNLLRDWWEMAAAERREIARALAPALRDKPTLLRDYLSSPGAAQQAAVSLVRLAQVADVFAEPLKGLAVESGNSRIQSAAVAAVSDSMAKGVADVLEVALRSGDARVRANALEGLDRLQARDEVFLRFTSDPNNRVRANAALALIERDRPEGRETLRQMLTGGEAERVSALWVFSKTRPSGFRRTAEILARQDPSTEVRRKASELLTVA